MIAAQAAEPRTEQSALSAFLTALHPAGYRDLRALKDGSVVQAFNAEASHLGQVEEFIETWNGCNLYFGVAPRIDAKGRGTAHLLALHALFVDFDFKDLPEVEVRARLAKFPLVPSAIVLSGGGIHAYWFLFAPLDLRDGSAPRARAILRALATQLGGDPGSAEPAHILRLPGGLNHKYAPPRPVVLEYVDEACAYGLDTVLEHLPAIPETPVEKPKEPVAHGLSVEARVQAARSWLAKQEPAIQGKGGEAHTFSVCCAVVLGHDLTDLEALEALKEWNARCVPPWKLEGRKDLLLRKVQNAELYGDEQRGGRLPQGEEQEYQRLLKRARLQERVRLEIQQERKTADAFAEPKILTLRERLALPRKPHQVRISGWQGVGHRVIVSAQFKSGKTVLVANTVRSLLDGTPFLDHYDVSPVQGAVAVLDFEMAQDEPGQLDDWYRAIGVESDDRLYLIGMRGRAGAFDLTDRDVRAQWASRLRAVGAKYVVLDCLRPVLDALGLDENHETGTFLVALDALLHDADVPEALIVHHMGHANERARGDSRLLDWPDVNWTLVRESADPASARFLKAYGRDVDVGETRLSYNSGTRRLGVVGGSRVDAKRQTAEQAVLRVLKEAAKDEAKEWMVTQAIVDELSPDVHRNAVFAAVKGLHASGLLELQRGEGNAKRYRMKRTEGP